MDALNVQSRSLSGLVEGVGHAAARPHDRRLQEYRPEDQLATPLRRSTLPEPALSRRPAPEPEPAPEPALSVSSAGTGMAQEVVQVLRSLGVALPGSGTPVSTLQTTDNGTAVREALGEFTRQLMGAVHDAGDQGGHEVSHDVAHDVAHGAASDTERDGAHEVTREATREAPHGARAPGGVPSAPVAWVTSARSGPFAGGLGALISAVSQGRGGSGLRSAYDRLLQHSGTPQGPDLPQFLSQLQARVGYSMAAPTPAAYAGQGASVLRGGGVGNLLDFRV